MKKKYKCNAGDFDILNESDSLVTIKLSEHAIVPCIIPKDLMSFVSFISEDREFANMVYQRFVEERIKDNIKLNGMLEEQKRL